MKEVKQDEFKKLTGVHLPKGKYRFAIDGDKVVYNTIKDDTAGCILLGENREKGRVVNSTPYELRLTRLIKEAIQRGEEVWITVE